MFLRWSITYSVSGLSPNQMKKDSAACSTNIPRPSLIEAPLTLAHARKGVTELAYAKS